MESKKMKKAKKLIIEAKDGLITFENLDNFSQIELIGILEAAIKTVDVLYKVKILDIHKEISKTE